MMRPESLALPPNPVAAGSITWAITGSGNNRHVTLTWPDNSITETSYLIQRTTDGTTWVDAGTLPVTLAVNNTKGTLRTFTDPTSDRTTPYIYRVITQNTVGYGNGFPTMTAKSTPTTVGVNLPALPAAPSLLSATAQFGPQVALSWRDNSTTEATFLIERAVGAGAFAPLTSVAGIGGTGTRTFVDTTVSPSTAYQYRVTAVNLTGKSGASNTATVSIGALLAQAPTTTATGARSGANERLTVNWTAVTGATGYTVQWSSTADFATVAGSQTTTATGRSLTTGNIARQIWFVRVGARNTVGNTWSNVVQVASP